MLVIPKLERFELKDSQNRTRVLRSVEKLDTLPGAQDDSKRSTLQQN